jgi:hypothetical protein
VKVSIIRDDVHTDRWTAIPTGTIEPISKLLEEHGDGGELNKTQKVGGVVPANQ